MINDRNTNESIYNLVYFEVLFRFQNGVLLQNAHLGKKFSTRSLHFSICAYTACFHKKRHNQHTQKAGKGERFVEAKVEELGAGKGRVQSSAGMRRINK